jgi:isopenicillin-N epimerase
LVTRKKRAGISTRNRAVLQIPSANLFGVRYPNTNRISSGRKRVFYRVLKSATQPGARSGYGYAVGTHMPVNTAAITAPRPPAPLLERPDEHFLLDASIDFLNHGPFGARPIAVMEAQSRRRAEFEMRPVEFLDPHRRGGEMLRRARHALSPFIGASADDFAFVTNATGGVNAVLRSLHFEPGDELLTTTHVYNAVRQTMKHLAQRSGATYREADIPLPLTNDGEIVHAIESAITPRTRLLVVDHVTSPTAVIFPVKRIVDLCARREIDVLIDGAHAPGMIPLDIESIAPAYYAGNLHKWVCAPVGSAFLYVRPDRQKGIHPTTISHHLDQGFQAEFGWQATRDITPWLCVEDALTWLGRMGWDNIMRHNHQLAVWAQHMLSQKWGVHSATPTDGRMIGSMTTIPLPHQETFRKRFDTFQALKAAMYDRHRIEVPIIEWGTPSPRWWVRVSCQIYNRPEQYERLGHAALSLIEIDTCGD